MTDSSLVQQAWALYRRGGLAQALRLLRVCTTESGSQRSAGDLTPADARVLAGDRLAVDTEVPTIPPGAAWEVLGLVYHDLGRPYEAADAIEKASLWAPVCDEARIALASSYGQLRRIDLARDLYLELAISRRLSPELMLEVAAGLHAIDLPSVAMQVCEWSIERDDDVAQTYYDMAFYAAASEQPLYVAESLTIRSLQLDPGKVHYRIGWVTLLLHLDRPDEAITALEPIEPSQVAQITCRGCLARIIDLMKKRDVHPLLLDALQQHFEWLDDPSRQAEESQR